MKIFVLGLSFLFTQVSFSQSYKNTKRGNIIKMCEEKYGGIVSYGKETTKMIDGVEHTCLGKVKCQESDESGRIDIEDSFDNACIETREWNRKISEKKIQVIFDKDDTCKGDCGDGKHATIGKHKVTSSQIPMRCMQEYRKFSRFNNKWDGRKGWFFKHKQRRYNRLERKLLTCLAGSKSGSCYKQKDCKVRFVNDDSNYEGRHRHGGSTVHSHRDECYHRADSDGCISSEEEIAIRRDYEEDYEDCPDCKSGKRKRGRDRSSRGGNGAFWGFASNLVGAAAHFGSNYFGAKFQKDAITGVADACATAYGSYSDAWTAGAQADSNAFIASQDVINQTNNHVATHNAKYDQSLDWLTYKDAGTYDEYGTPRSPNCNGQFLGAFSGFGGLSGVNGNFFGSPYVNQGFQGAWNGYNQGFNGFNPYGSLGINLGGSINGGGFNNYPGNYQGGYYNPNIQGAWGAYGNGQLPYGQGGFGVGSNFGYPGPGNFGQGTYPWNGGSWNGGINNQWGANNGQWGQWGQNGQWGQGQYSNPQDQFLFRQTSQSAMQRDAQFYQQRLFQNGNFNQFNTFPPF